MLSLKLKSLSLPHFHYAISRPFLFSSVSNLVTNKRPNPLLHDFLIQVLHFPTTRAFTIATHSRYSNLNSLQNPLALVHYFQSLGFSLKQIQSSVHLYHQILLIHIDNTLKPKIEFFQQLGLQNSHLGKFFSTNPSLLKRSLERQLIPSVQLLRKILVNDKDNKDLFKVFHKSSWIIDKDIESEILPKIRFLKKCGIVGDQLAMLLRERPRLFCWDEAVLRNLVSKVSDLGFKMNSRMFAYALCAVSGCSDDTLKGKVRTFERYGFSKDDYMLMAKQLPCILNISTNKAITGIDFYLNTVKLTKEVLIRDPKLLMYSLENRVKPRCRVLEVIKCKQLLKKQPEFSTVMSLTEEVFLQKFISKFANHKEELLKSYKGHTLVSSSREESSKS